MRVVWVAQGEVPKLGWGHVLYELNRAYGGASGWGDWTVRGPAGSPIQVATAFDFELGLQGGRRTPGMPDTGGPETRSM